MSEFVDVEALDRVLVIRFNRPDRLNALTHAMYAASADALDRAAEDPEIRAVVFAANGKSFTAGNDLNDFAGPPPEGKLPVLRFLEALRDAPKPLIAVVNGPAIGIGLTMLLHCDLSFASEAATFRAPFAQIGLVPEAASSLLLPQALGTAWANDILIAGRILNAQEALSAGLISRVYSTEELLPKSLETAAAIAAQAPIATQRSKQLIRSGKAAVTERMAEEMVVFNQQLRSAEFAESVAAFRENRPPRFE
ncbi:MAG: enoyl-CoA hydratase-related protein [Acidobacteriota bacterium]